MTDSEHAIFCRCCMLQQVRRSEDAHDAGGGGGGGSGGSSGGSGGGGWCVCGASHQASEVHSAAALRAAAAKAAGAKVGRGVGAAAAPAARAGGAGGVPAEQGGAGVTLAAGSPAHARGGASALLDEGLEGTHCEADADAGSVGSCKLRAVMEYLRALRARPPSGSPCCIRTAPRRRCRLAPAPPPRPCHLFYSMRLAPPFAGALWRLGTRA
jgi:hypothetical protein